MNMYEKVITALIFELRLCKYKAEFSLSLTFYYLQFFVCIIVYCDHSRAKRRPPHNNQAIILRTVSSAENVESKWETMMWFTISWCLWASEARRAAILTCWLRERFLIPLSEWARAERTEFNLLFIEESTRKTEFAAYYIRVRSIPSFEVWHCLSNQGSIQAAQKVDNGERTEWISSELPKKEREKDGELRFGVTVKTIRSNLRREWRKGSNSWVHHSWLSC